LSILSIKIEKKPIKSYLGVTFQFLSKLSIIIENYRK
jgi:hypothetical protein